MSRSKPNKNDPRYATRRILGKDNRIVKRRVLRANLDKYAPGVPDRSRKEFLVPRSRSEIVAAQIHGEIGFSDPDALVRVKFFAAGQYEKRAGKDTKAYEWEVSMEAVVVASRVEDLRAELAASISARNPVSSDFRVEIQSEKPSQAEPGVKSLDVFVRNKRHPYASDSVEEDVEQNFDFEAEGGKRSRSATIEYLREATFDRKVGKWRGPDGRFTVDPEETGYL